MYNVQQACVLQEQNEKYEKRAKGIILKANVMAKRGYLMDTYRLPLSDRSGRLNQSNLGYCCGGTVTFH